jgi:hypothetical protein
METRGQFETYRNSDGILCIHRDTLNDCTVGDLLPENTQVYFVAGYMTNDEKYIIMFVGPAPKQITGVILGERKTKNILGEWEYKFSFAATSEGGRERILNTIKKYNAGDEGEEL